MVINQSTAAPFSYHTIKSYTSSTWKTTNIKGYYGDIHVCRQISLIQSGNITYKDSAGPDQLWSESYTVPANQ